MRSLISFVGTRCPFPFLSPPRRPRFICSMPPKNIGRPFFMNTPLTRNAPNSLPGEVDKLLNLPGLFLPFWRDQPLVHQKLESESWEPVLWTPDKLRQYLISVPNPLTVPLSRTSSPSTLYFAVDVSESEIPPVTTGERASAVRTVLPRLSETHAYLVAHGKALLSWHASTIYCSRCGTRTHVTQAGSARLCPNDKCRTRNIYPRVMPSIMAAVTRPETDSMLLGRKASWPRGRYSVLAGFAEIFECLEDTVVREVFEETGVRVRQDTIRYIASQPWPSGPHASLMSGFRAEVYGEENSRIIVDAQELEDARWFERSELLHGLDNNTIDIPGRTSLARPLILNWLQEKERVGGFEEAGKNNFTEAYQQ